MALSCGGHEICRLLINRGASLKHVNSNGKGIANSLAMSCESEVPIFSRNVRLLLSRDFDGWSESPPQNSPFCPAELAYLLVRLGAWPNQTYMNKKTALHYAVEGGNIDLVRLLMIRGTEVNASDNQGRTPMHYALGDRFEKASMVVAELLQHGADVDARCHRGKTPLMRAVRSRDTTGLLCLLAHDADVNAVDSSGRTALWYALRYDDDLFAERMDIMFAHGADPHICCTAEMRKPGYAYGPVLLATATLGDHIIKDCIGERGRIVKYIAALQRKFSEVVFDHEEDIFWDAPEELHRSYGYGSSYLSECRKDCCKENKFFKTYGYHGFPKGLDGVCVMCHD